MSAGEVEVMDAETGEVLISGPEASAKLLLKAALALARGLGRAVEVRGPERSVMVEPDGRVKSCVPLSCRADDLPEGLRRELLAAMEGMARMLHLHAWALGAAGLTLWRPPGGPGVAEALRGRQDWEDVVPPGSSVEARMVAALIAEATAKASGVGFEVLLGRWVDAGGAPTPRHSAGHHFGVLLASMALGLVGRDGPIGPASAVTAQDYVSPALPSGALLFTYDAEPLP